jgi:hypothetical protein
MNICPLILAGPSAREDDQSSGKIAILDGETGYGEFELCWLYHPRGLQSDPPAFRSPTDKRGHNSLRLILWLQHRFKLDRHDDPSVAIVWTIYTRTDRPRLHAIRRVGTKILFLPSPDNQAS